MCFKEVDNYNHALEFVSECYKTQIETLSESKLMINILLQFNMFLKAIML